VVALTLAAGRVSSIFIPVMGLVIPMLMSVLD
jgi:hypothetical protein